MSDGFTTAQDGHVYRRHRTVKNRRIEALDDQREYLEREMHDILQSPDIRNWEGDLIPSERRDYSPAKKLEQEAAMVRARDALHQYGELESEHTKLFREEKHLLELDRAAKQAQREMTMHDLDDIEQLFEEGEEQA